MGETKKESEALQEKVQLTEDKLAAMKSEAYKFSETISDATIKVARLCHLLWIWLLRSSYISYIFLEAKRVRCCLELFH